MENRIIIRGFILLITVVYLLRLLYLQVFDESYKLAAENNAIVKEIQVPYRGQVYDRNNKLIVYNTPVYDLYITPRKARVADTLRFCQLFDISRSSFDSLATIARKYSKVKPSLFLRQLSLQDYARVQDVMVDYPGFSFQKSALRSYTSKTMANALGYVSEISEKQLKNQEDDYYSQGDYVGQSGLEKQYEKELRGRRGVKFKMVDVRGVEKGAFKAGEYDTTAIMGQNLYSTVDLDLQQYADSLMRNKVGSIVAIEPASGEILCMTSAPTYDPNLLAGRNFSKYYRSISNDPTKPLINRPMQALYRPGSTFKLIQTAIALQEGVVVPSTFFPCGGAPVKCHGHASGDLRNAIRFSCNPYFYRVFQRIVYNNNEPNVFKKSAIGLRRWNEMAAKFGIGQQLGVDLPYERKGRLPNVQYYDKVYKGVNRWKFSNIYSLSIGEGELDISPIKMANVAAIFANRGWYKAPHMVRGLGKVGNIDPKYNERFETGINRRHYEVIADGMEMVVNGGTVAARARIPDLQVCGKTGTSQNAHGKDDHSIFICFAPKYNPKIAMAVFVENGGMGGIAAAPIASLLLEKYLKKRIDLKGLQTEVMNRSYIERVLSGGKRSTFGTKKKSELIETSVQKPQTGTKPANNEQQPNKPTDTKPKAQPAIVPAKPVVPAAVKKG
jgi:penicillin-binding protein 2